MRAYGRKKRKNKIHPHHTCGICNSSIPTKGTARMRLKEQLKKDMDYLDTG